MVHTNIEHGYHKILANKLEPYNVKKSWALNEMELALHISFITKGILKNFNNVPYFSKGQQGPYKKNH